MANDFENDRRFISSIIKNYIDNSFKLEDISYTWGEIEDLGKDIYNECLRRDNELVAVNIINAMTKSLSKESKIQLLKCLITWM